MSELYVYYRTSDKGNLKDKIEWATPMYCLNMAIEEFGSEYITVIADNCEKSTVEELKKLGVRIIETSLGNSQSFRYMVELIIQERNDDDIVYMLENDYLHKPGSKAALLEGIEIADYVTLYDHPDYYIVNHLNRKDGNNPLMWRKPVNSRIYISENYHWRQIYSTTMTFASKVGTLKKDAKRFNKWLNGRIPLDFAMWLELTNDSIRNVFCTIIFRRLKGFCGGVLGLFGPRRLLVSVLPSMSTHTENAYLAQGFTKNENGE